MVSDWMLIRAKLAIIWWPLSTWSYAITSACIILGVQFTASGHSFAGRKKGRKWDLQKNSGHPPANSEGTKVHSPEKHQSESTSRKQ
jgi:hypothetical protein